MVSGERKAEVLHEVLRRLRNREAVAPELFSEFVDVQNEGASAGLEIGAVAPDFSLVDQEGRSRSLGDLAGPSGLLTVFTRSADW